MGTLFLVLFLLLGDMRLARSKRSVTRLECCLFILLDQGGLVLLLSGDWFHHILAGNMSNKKSTFPQFLASFWWSLLRHSWPLFICIILLYDHQSDLTIGQYTYSIGLLILFIWTTAQLKSLPTYLFNRYRNPF